MQRDRLSTLHTLAIVTGALAGGILGPAAPAEAQETSAQAEGTSPDAEETSAAAGKTSSDITSVRGTGLEPARPKDTGT